MSYYRDYYDEFDQGSDLNEELDEKLLNKESRYKCDICKYSTTELRYLKKHKQCHETGKYKCQQCDYTDHKPYLLKTHIRKIHDIKSIEYICERENPEIKHYVCNKCHYSNTDKLALEEHFKRKHILSRSSSNMSGEEKSEVVKEEEFMEDDEIDPQDVGNKYQCTRCDYIAKKRVYLEDHMSGGRKFTKCPWCELHFKITHGKGKLGRHLTTDHGMKRTNDRWICNDCGQELDRLRYFLHHMAKLHKVGTMLHCDQCQYSSYDRQNLIHHAKDHDVASHPCPQCSHMAKSKARLTKHIYDTHKKMEREKKTARPLCTICGKSFHSAGALGTHIKGKIYYFLDTFFYLFWINLAVVHIKPNNYFIGMHSTEKLECENCDYVTHNQHNMNHHMKTRNVTFA